MIPFSASEEARSRVADLVAREKWTGLTLEEKLELDRYLQIEHLMRLVKAYIRQILS